MQTVQISSSVFTDAGSVLSGGKVYRLSTEYYSVQIKRRFLIRSKYEAEDG